MDSENERSLRDWQEMSEQSMSDSTDDPILQKLNAAIKKASFLTICYYGGSSPGRSRSIRPERIFLKGGSDYVEAYCEKAGELRTFKVSRIRIGEYGFQPEPPSSYVAPVARGGSCPVLLIVVPVYFAEILQAIVSLWK